MKIRNWEDQYLFTYETHKIRPENLGTANLKGVMFHISELNRTCDEAELRVVEEANLGAGFGYPAAIGDRLFQMGITLYYIPQFVKNDVDLPSGNLT